MVELIGMFSSAAIAVLAYVRSRGPGGFYDAEVYGLTPRTHRQYGIVALAFLAGFGMLWRLANPAATGAVATVFVIFALFYLTSFLRGFSDSDE